MFLIKTDISVESRSYCEKVLSRKPDVLLREIDSLQCFQPILLSLQWLLTAVGTDEKWKNKNK